MSKAPTLEEFGEQGGEVNVLVEVCVYDTLMGGRPGVDPEKFQLARQIVHDLAECGVCLEHHDPT